MKENESIKVEPVLQTVRSAVVEDGVARIKFQSGAEFEYSPEICEAGRALAFKRAFDIDVDAAQDAVRAAVQKEIDDEYEAGGVGYREIAPYVVIDVFQTQHKIYETLQKRYAGAVAEQINGMRDIYTEDGPLEEIDGSRLASYLNKCVMNQKAQQVGAGKMCVMIETEQGPMYFYDGFKNVGNNRAVWYKAVDPFFWYGKPC